MSKPLLEGELGSLNIDGEFYPIRCSRWLGETSLHGEQTYYCREMLGMIFAANQNVYIAGREYLYWKRGNALSVVAPDCYIVFGVPNHWRQAYFAWKHERALPAIVIEITSKKTRRQDTRKKFRIYEQVLKVPEYFLFDPTQDYLNPPLQGFRLVNGVYEPILLVDNGMHSDILNLDLVWIEQVMRFRDPVRNKILLPYTELAELNEQAKKTCQLARATERAERETLRAERETLRAEHEESRANTAERENESLRAEMEAMRKQLEQKGQE